MVSVAISGGTINNVQRIGSIEQIKDVRISSDVCPKVNDESIIDHWSLSQTAAAIISAVAAAKAIEAANKQYDIAKDYYNLAKDEWDHFKTNYRPLEELELAEIRTEQKHVPEYNKTISGMTKAFPQIWGNADKRKRSLAEELCLCLDKDTYVRYQIEKNTITGDTDNFARRYAEVRARKLNERRSNRRLSAANRGRNLFSSSTSYAAKAASFYGEYAQAVSGLASGAANYFQYQITRRETQYNSKSRSIMDTKQYNGGSFAPGNATIGSTVPKYGSGGIQKNYVPDTFDNSNAVAINSLYDGSSYMDNYSIGGGSLLYNSQGTGGGIANA